MAINNNPIKYSDLIQPDNSIEKLIQQLDQASDAYMNFAENIKKEAIKIKTQMQGVSGATSENRKRIAGGAGDAEKLAKAYKDMEFAMSKTNEEILKAKAIQQEETAIKKLLIRLNNSAEGSYDKLSAQYSLNKISLNGMTRAEREATEDGQKLEAETKAIYEEMNRLQKATGKSQLQVGQYERANKDLTTTLRNNTYALAQMKMAGEENTAEYRKLAQETGVLKDALMDATQEVKNMASDTSNFDSILGGMAAAGGAFSAATGAMELFGASGEAVEEAQKKLQAAIAITTGLTAIQNNIQKQSSLMLGISKIQQSALTKAKLYDRLVTMQGTKATVAATVAQRIFNLVAAANPYVLLAIALVTVVGVLVAFAASTDKSAKSQKKLNEQEKAWLEYLEAESDKIKTVGSQREEQLTRELNKAKARNASLVETRKIEDDLAAEKTKTHGKLMGFYGEEIDELEANRAKLDQLREMLLKVQQAKAKGDSKIKIDVDLDGKIDKVKVDDAIDAIQGQIDNYQKKVDIAVNLKTEGADLEAERAIQAAQRQKEDRDNAKKELDILRKAEDGKIALIRESYAQQIAVRKASAARAIQDIKTQLATDANLSTKARKALNSQIASIQEQLTVDLKDIANKRAAEELAAQRTTQDAQIALMAEGADKQRKELQIQYERQIEDITTRLATERDLTETQVDELYKQQLLLKQQYAVELEKLDSQIAIDQNKRDADAIQLKLDAVREGSDEELDLRNQLLEKQRAIELAENAKLAKDLQQSEKDINAKYDAEKLKQIDDFNSKKELLLFDQMQALDASEFDLLRNSEAKKTQFRLQQEKARLQKILELNQKAGIKLSDAEVKTIENTIKKIDQEINDSKKDSTDIYTMFGLNLDDEQKSAINESTQYAIEQVTAFLDAKVQAAEAAVTAANNEVDAAKNAVDAEIEARNNGYASNVAMAQKELDLAKRNQAKALAEQRKAQKAQQAIETLQQVSSLVTATAGIWKSFAGTGPWGIALAIAGTALMWGSFAAAKIKAAQVTKQQSESYGEGTVELLEGGSHASGNDIDLGTKKDGTKRRAEGGEFFAVIKKASSRKYRRIIPDVVNSLNKGDFESRYLNAYDTGNMTITVNNRDEGQDLSELKSDVAEIRKQNEKRWHGNTMYYKNLKRTYVA